ncbi:Glutaredoxin-C14 [Hibiscus syriacus]|uniref:Glutaredoxin-C14 n=1 Tax=Hibiscus syriacus TaxID=106335 RepID=A0A6A2XSA5_HIBSY|nr:Glutaredoxin-C14 [Hibiscus syriacus]
MYRGNIVNPGVNMDKVTRLALEKGAVLFSKSSCCMCYAVTILFQELTVTPIIHEINQDLEGGEIDKALIRLGCNAPVLAIFIGGRLVCSMNEVMSLHLSGELISLLKPYQTVLN